MVDLSDIDDETFVKHVRAMLERQEKIWSGHLGEIRVVEHQIDLKPGTRPLCQQTYINRLQRCEIIEEPVDKMLSADVIEPTQSDWASPIVIAPKKDGITRFFVDCRKHIEVSIPESYPITLMDYCVDILGNYSVYSVLDANWGYWQMPIAEEDHEKATFANHRGAFPWL